MISARGWIFKVNEKGDVQTVASAMLGMSFVHRNSADRPSDAGHPEMYTAQYTGPT
jgi:hypothetical protein